MLVDFFKNKYLNNASRGKLMASEDGEGIAGVHATLPSSSAALGAA